MLTVCCVLSHGDGGYTAEHVLRLRKQLEGRITESHNFVCLTNHLNVSCHTLPLKHDWPGWWSKIELFRPGQFVSRVLYLDLDVTIVDSLDDMLANKAPFVITRDFLQLGFNSSVMLWSPPAGERIYKSFHDEVMDKHHGDQTWITTVMNDTAQTFRRRAIISYKMHVIENVVPEGAKIVVYHGLPNPWDVEEIHFA